MRIGCSVQYWVSYGDGICIFAVGFILLRDGGGKFSLFIWISWDSILITYQKQIVTIKYGIIYVLFVTLCDLIALVRLCNLEHS